MADNGLNPQIIDDIKAIVVQARSQVKQAVNKGIDRANLRCFYLAIEKQDALRLELSWTHYRTLKGTKKDLAQRLIMEALGYGD